MNKPRIFISYAKEDKATIAEPLARELAERGFGTWFDEFELSVGDSLRRKIDEGIRQCDFGVVVLSQHFFSKSWPKVELDALFTKEIVAGTKVLLPVWHGLYLPDVAKQSAFLAARLGISTDKGLKSVADAIQDAILGTDPKPASSSSVTDHDVYREFVRAAISNELKIPIGSITPRTGRGSAPSGAGTIFSGVDLIHIGGNELAEVITLINCDFHQDSNQLTKGTEVLRLSYLRNETRASKAMLVSNVGFSAAANNLAQKEKVALLKLTPTDLMARKLSRLADQSVGSSLIEEIEQFIGKQQGPSYDKVVVRRLHGGTDEGELIGELMQNPEVAEKAREILRDPGARRTVEKVLDENPDIHRIASDFIGKFRP